MGVEEFEFEEDLEAEEELDMYEVHTEQKEWERKLLEKSGTCFAPIRPPERVVMIDESSSPKRMTRPTMQEMQSMRKSGLWVFKAEGFEKGEWTVHVSMATRGRDGRR